MPVAVGISIERVRMALRRLDTYRCPFQLDSAGTDEYYSSARVRRAHYYKVPILKQVVDRVRRVLRAAGRNVGKSVRESGKARRQTLAATSSCAM